MSGERVWMAGAVTDVKISVFVIRIELIICLFLQGLHGCTFNAGVKICFLCGWLGTRHRIQAFQGFS